MSLSPGAYAPFPGAPRQAELLALIRKLPDPVAANALARLLLPWVQHRLEHCRSVRLLRGSEAADAVQEITVTLLQALEKVNVDDAGKLEGLLEVIIRRRFCNYCRNDRRQPRGADVTEAEKRETLCRRQDSSWQCQDPAELAAMRELLARLQGIERHLDAMEQRLWQLRQSGLSLSAIATRMGLHVSAVKRRWAALWAKIRREAGLS
jgi:RNA polymerase sigma factor (sigma-70 family)